MTTQYQTQQGEMWDYISRKVYGTERFCNVLMRANPQYLPVVSFDAGIVLNTPQISVTKKISSVPWGSVYLIDS